MVEQVDKELGNNGEPLPAEVNEDAQKEERVMVLAEMEAAKAVQKSPEDEKPFDPASIVANILKKKEG